MTVCLLKLNANTQLATVHQPFTFFTIHLCFTAVVAQCDIVFAPQAKGWVFERPKSQKQVVTAPLLNARQ